MTTNPLITHWYFHLPNLILAALMYTMLGRFVLSFIFDEKSDNFIWRFFVRFTEPAVRLFRFFTPLAVPPLLMLPLSAVWLFAARCLLLIVLLIFGLAPTPGIAPQ